jgi:CheY-like chemotaxis protein/CHASE3 domain sensor protein
MSKISFKYWIIIGINVSLLLVFTVGLISYLSLEKLKKDQDWVLHTEIAIAKSNNVIKLLTDGETSQRGYVITGNEIFLNNYNKSVPKINVELDNLSELVNDNLEQKNRVENLKILVKNKEIIMGKVIDERKNKDYKFDQRILNLINSGKKSMDLVRDEIDRVIVYENSLLNIRKTASNNSSLLAKIVIIVGTILIFIVVIILFLFISKTFKTQAKIRNELNTKNLEFQSLFLINAEKTWLSSGYTIIDDAMRGVQTVNVRTSNLVNEIAKYVGAEMGVVYLVDDENSEILVKSADYAFPGNENNKLNINEGLIGQVSKEKKRKIWNNVPDDYFKIKSGLGSTKPQHLLIEPIFFQSNLKAVFEFAFLNPITEKVLTLFDNVNSIVGVGINASQDRVKMKTLFEETQFQAEELQSQQEELRVTNEELINKTQMLQASEEELRVQQEELREINSELEEKANLLEEKNRVIEDARAAIVLKMAQLEQSGKYKSEFLANMSHELRTPLNSILILARILKDNKNDNLSVDEAKYANVIFKAGNDLLELINDILDLAKIESGKVELNFEAVEIDLISEDLTQLFAEVAKNKDINYQVTIDKLLPKNIVTDKIRIEQIIKNLLSNAFKFTPKNGSVTVDFVCLEDTQQIKIDVTDTGIGIPEEKQALIFEAFQQADGSTSREYGGTGLGLSICRELSQRMNGKIVVKSEAGKGSTFSLIVPLENHDVEINSTTEKPVDRMSTESHKGPAIQKDIKAVKPLASNVKPLLLIVEDDKVFNDFLKDYGIDHGFEVIQVFNGEDAIAEAINQQPQAILLDIMLPGIDGWKVLKRLKSEESTKFIPVHMMSAGDQREEKALKSGALSFISKPVDKDQLDQVFHTIIEPDTLHYKNILLVEDHQVQSDALAEIFRNKDINVKQAFTGQEALASLEKSKFDCVILDINLPDISGVDLLEKIKSNDHFKDLPVIINTAMELNEEMLNKLLKYSNATVMKSNKSSDRLIDEVNLFLHKIKNDDLAASPKSLITTEAQLTGKNILVVDDDMRNIFALTAILAGVGFNVEIANDGLEALNHVNDKSFDLVLMDIMMPKMDGYEAMKEIRKKPKLQKLPIIALTAKAMKEDRDLCIAAGANDYITKPVDVDKLLALIKIWIA